MPSLARGAAAQPGGPQEARWCAPLLEGLEDAARHLLPVAAELLEATARLTDEERAAVGKYLEVATEILRRHARG